MNTFKQRLQKLIDIKNFSQREVADELGINEARISEWLSGKVKAPRRTTIIKLAILFECDVNWLADGSGAPFPTNDGPAEEIAKNNFGKYQTPENRQNLYQDKFVGPSKYEMSEQEEQYESLNENELLDQTTEVLRSKTVYRGALASNIKAFHKAVRGEKEMDGMKDQISSMQAQLDRIEKLLKKENQKDEGAEREVQADFGKWGNI